MHGGFWFCFPALWDGCILSGFLQLHTLVYVRLTRLSIFSSLCILHSFLEAKTATISLASLSFLTSTAALASSMLADTNVNFLVLTMGSFEIRGSTFFNNGHIDSTHIWIDSRWGRYFVQKKSDTIQGRRLCSFQTCVLLINSSSRLISLQNPSIMVAPFSFGISFRWDKVWDFALTNLLVNKKAAESHCRRSRLVFTQEVILSTAMSAVNLKMLHR